MAIVCSICQDALSERPQCLSDREELVSVALSCGHLFHKVCIHVWFQHRSANSVNNRFVDCPFCKKCCSLDNALRLYPTVDQSDPEVPRSAEQAESERKLQKKLDDARESVAQLNEALAFERDAHDALKFQHGMLQSKLHQLNLEMNEAKDVYATLEASLNHKIQKLEEDNSDATKANYEMKKGGLRIHQQLNLLKTLMVAKTLKSNAAEKSVEEDLVDQILLEFAKTCRTCWSGTTESSLI